MEDARGVGPGPRREHLGHQRRGHRPLAADAQRDQEPQRGDVPELRGEVGEAGEDRVEEDGQRHRRLAAEAVGERAEDDPAERAAEEEDGQEQTSPQNSAAVLRRSARAMSRSMSSRVRLKSWPSKASNTQPADAIASTSHW